MSIRKTGPRAPKGLKKHVSRCWECDEQSAILFIRPSDQKPVCMNCAPRDKSVAEVPNRAKKA